MRPLEGVTILDFSTLLPGPLAGLILAEAGAEVIKVERPGGGDEARLFPPFERGDGLPFALLNRGKSSLALDLKSEAGRAELEPFLERADVLIEQFRPGAMSRLGLDYETLAERRPGLIYCSITGYGQTGPLANRAGHDLNYIAEAGLLSLSMGPPDRPAIPPALIADIAGGAYPAVMNILLALEARRRTGRGAHLDISMTDNLYPLMWWALARHAGTGTVPGNADQLLNGGTARYHLYPTRDGETVAAGPIEDRFWVRFCEAIGLEESLRDDRADPAATLAGVGEIIAARDASHWEAVFEKADCCCCLVRGLDDALSTGHVAARGLTGWKTLTPSGAVIPALPVPVVPEFRGDRDAPEAAPALGQANADGGN